MSEGRASSPKRTPRRTARRGVTHTVALVQLWGQDLGAVSEAPTGEISFEYDAAFRSAGWEVSPLRLPVALRGPQSFPELRRKNAFQGLPGLLADSLPDTFGNAVIKQYFDRKGDPKGALSPVQRLLYLGRRAMGALEFHPPLKGTQGPAIEEALEVAALVEQARRVIEGATDVAIPEMMQVGATAGGARAKALILWDQAQGTVRSGFATPRAAEESWLIKFDGVSGASGGHNLTGSFQPGPYGRIEYAYSVLARRAGITMAETHLLRERDFGHFMTKRFDRHAGERVHMHTLGGLLHVDYNDRGAASYEDYFRAIRELGMGQQEVNEAYRRMVFNVVMRNQDDHVKNLSFLMRRDGAWRLAPAYDMTWSVGGAWARSHQMTLGGKDDQFSLQDLLQIGASFDVPRDGAEIIEAVEAAAADWPVEAVAAGISKKLATEMAAEFRRLRPAVV